MRPCASRLIPKTLPKYHKTNHWVQRHAGRGDRPRSPAISWRTTENKWDAQGGRPLQGVAGMFCPNIFTGIFVIGGRLVIAPTGRRRSLPYNKRGRPRRRPLQRA